MGLINTRAFKGGQIRGAVGAATATLALIGAALVWAPQPAGALSTSCAGQDTEITGANIDAAEASLFCLINVYRQDNGLGRLTRDSRLDQAARSYSQDMVNRDFFDHTSPEGTEHDDRMKAAGFPADQVNRTGENLACDPEPATPLGLFGAWEESPSHRAEMLVQGYTLTGIGIAPGAPSECEFTTGATATNLFSTPLSSGGGGGGGGTAEPPKEGERVALAVTRGTVKVKPRGSSSYQRLNGSDDFEIGSTIDATRGALLVFSDYNGATEVAEFASGQFVALQTAGADPTFSAKLVGSFGAKAAGAAADAAKKKGKRGKRKLWGNTQGGHFRTQGRRGAATVRGTRWLTVDIRTGRSIRTSFRSLEGILDIDDFTIAGNVNAQVGPGQTYVAGKKRKRR